MSDIMSDTKLIEIYGIRVEPITNTTYRELYDAMLSILYSDDSTDNSDLLCTFASHHIIEQLKSSI